MKHQLIKFGFVENRTTRHRTSHWLDQGLLSYRQKQVRPSASLARNLARSSHCHLANIPGQSQAGPKDGRWGRWPRTCVAGALPALPALQPEEGASGGASEAGASLVLSPYSAGFRRPLRRPDSHPAGGRTSGPATQLPA